ncbi:Cytochrome c553 (plasmid) [Phaeobacter inhibens]|jgi:cytochrome c|uniref:Cytochrome c553 n=1 Tax=Phaeobacter gallaeciensis TaxID=60890 RepID=A0AAC9ZDJ7_9RHOB|nr:MULTISPECIES: cytochrome c [Rhodobacterales]AHD11777.1 Cytochrome c553 [Phaeobacter gallaeciensis DSM 26640]ATE95041.1 Cytochrome c553 [Phaeobacter gallaeciensis]ATE99307.1 Cytochrome c553 [Phaeobacter gallaeciensis]ATF03702.1 Cytochrome c553 [Phaeobacter gallaeciensis]ATF08470.1 Cytochrome c553 [Phaeobacter gallaeciensis]
MDKLTALIGAVFVIGGSVAAWQFIGTQDTAVGHSMTPPDTSEIAQGDPIVQVKLPSELSTQAAIGKNIFETKCSECHGENAAGRNDIAPPLVHKIYEPGHHSDMAFVLAAQNGVRAHHWKFGNMPKIEWLTQGDVKMVAAYVRELQRANGIN